MSRRRTYALAWPLLAAFALLLIPVSLASPFTYAQAEPTATAVATLAATATATLGTPTVTPTPTLTPTATPTLTELQARLMLANAYLEGGDYERAVQLFTEVAEADRGNAEALAGLRAALKGNSAQMATIMAPLPQPTPVPAPAVVTPSMTDTVGAKLREYAGIGIAALLLIVALYLVANLVRLLLYWAREVWYLRVLPLLGRPAVEPGYLIGQFTNNAGAPADNAAQLVPFALTEKLLAWNQLVQAKEVPVAPETAFDLGGMAWLKVFWSWILPAPRGYRVTGALLPGMRGAHRLVVQRIDLARNRVDRSTAFEMPGPTPELAYRDLAGEAAKWLVKPQDMEATAATMGGMRSGRSAGQVDMLTPSEIFDRALALLLPVRQQVNQGAIDFVGARERLAQAEALLTDLPSESSLRKDLQTVIEELRQSVPGE